MKSGDVGARVADVQLGGAEIGPRWLLTRDAIGTVGLDLLVGYAAVIDYPAQRFCVTPSADLPYALFKNTKWSDAVLRGGKLYVPVEIEGQRRNDFFFDTGASLFPVSTNFSQWQAITGRVQPSKGDRRILGNGMGHRVELIGAHSKQPIAIGSLPAQQLQVFYQAGTTDPFAEYPSPTAGFVGNAALWDRTVVLWLGATPQFGIVEEPAPQSQRQPHQK
jgi:hypothetical protein